MMPTDHARRVLEHHGIQPGDSTARLQGDARQEVKAALQALRLAERRSALPSRRPLGPPPKRPRVQAQSQSTPAQTKD